VSESTDSVGISGHLVVATWGGDPEPDVWWGEDGIDAMIWADGQPYSGPSDTFAQLPRMMAGEAP
jgi:hypothetical protein